MVQFLVRLLGSFHGFLGDSSVKEQFQQLSERLQANFPRAKLFLDIFGQTGAVLNIVLNQELYEIEWREQEGFGVTHVTDEKSFTRGSDVGFDKMPEAEQYLVAALAAIA